MTVCEEVCHMLDGAFMCVDVAFFGINSILAGTIPFAPLTESKPPLPTPKK